MKVKINKGNWKKLTCNNTIESTTNDMKWVENNCRDLPFSPKALAKTTSLKTYEQNNCRDLPIGGRARRDSMVRLPKKKTCRSRHQHLFEENVWKNKKKGLWILRIRVRELFTCEEGISTTTICVWNVVIVNVRTKKEWWSSLY